MTPQAKEPVWFSVRCLLQHDDGFEERITLWRARSYQDPDPMLRGERLLMRR